MSQPQGGKDEEGGKQGSPVDLCFLLAKQDEGSQAPPLGMEHAAVFLSQPTAQV